jgi:hypothetical protein
MTAARTAPSSLNLQVVAAEARRRCGEAMTDWVKDPTNPEKRLAFLHAIQAVETTQKAVKIQRERIRRQQNQQSRLSRVFQLPKAS